MKALEMMEMMQKCGYEIDFETHWSLISNMSSSCKGIRHLVKDSCQASHWEWGITLKCKSFVCLCNFTIM